LHHSVIGASVVIQTVCAVCCRVLSWRSLPLGVTGLSASLHVQSHQDH